MKEDDNKDIIIERNNIDSVSSVSNTSGTNKNILNATNISIPDIKSPNIPKSSKEIEETYIDLNILLMYEFKMSYKDICDLPPKVFERMIDFLRKRQEAYEKEIEKNKRNSRNSRGKR